jgi:hypothetical protein
MSSKVQRRSDGGQELLIYSGRPHEWIASDRSIEVRT